MARKNKQAIKRHKQNLKRQEQNRHVKSTVRSRVKLVLAAIEEKNIDGAREAFKEAQAHLDKAARKKVVQRRTAARKISRLSRKINKLAS